MFGPNKHLSTSVNINYSHRDKRFFSVYSSLSERFRTLFHMDEYEILFIPGSGTIGIESIFFSVLNNINVIGHDGVFTDRWKALSEYYYKNNNLNPIDMFCQLETTLSMTFNKKGCIVDAVSSFPYYDLPADTRIFVTSSNKQLGSMSGIVIVGVHKEFWNNIIDENTFSYLNLSLYRSYKNKHQTPTTAPTMIFDHLDSVLKAFSLIDLRRKIDTNSERIVDTIGGDNIIGEKTCPVITVPKSVIPDKIAEKWELYGYNKNSPHYQIFTYSCDDDDYHSFCSDLEKC